MRYGRARRPVTTSGQTAGVALSAVGSAY